MYGYTIFTFSDIPKSKPQSATKTSRRRLLSTPVGGAVGYFLKIRVTGTNEKRISTITWPLSPVSFVVEIYSEISILDVFKSDRGHPSTSGIHLYVLEYCGIWFICSELSS